MVTTTYGFTSSGDEREEKMLFEWCIGVDIPEMHIISSIVMNPLSIAPTALLFATPLIAPALERQSFGNIG